MATRAPVTVDSADFWRAFATTLRPYLMFISGAAGMVGLALAGELDRPVFVGSSMVFFLSYGLGQSVTDVFQTDTDALSAPERPLVRGEVRPQDVLGVALAGLALCAAWFALVNLWTLVVSAVCVFGLVTYTPMKRRWWAGPAWNAWIVALLPLIGVLCAGGNLVQALADGRVRLAMGATLFSYMVFVLLGYLKDVDADRATGYDTLAVHFGRRTAVVVSLACALAAAVLSRSLVLGETPGAAALWATGVLIMIGAHAVAWNVSSDDRAYPAITASVVGFVAVHLGMVAALIPSFTAAGWALAATAAIALTMRPSRRQV
jgi:4-hydroxybenzoate polyprenyltransferase